MKIFYKKRCANGQRNIYFFGVKIFSYQKHLSKYDKIYAKRFDGLSEKEIRYCLEKQFKRRLGYKLNFDNPKTFNEKIQWLKLYYHNPLMTKCADKVAVREYVAEKVGKKYLIQNLGVWDSPDDIDFDRLPEKFVLKVNWGCGQNIIVTDKSKVDINEIREKLRIWMQPQSNLYFAAFEWGYKNIVPKITAEEYLEILDKNSALDYKFLCFAGTPYLCWVSNKNKNVQERSFYDMNWNMMDIELVEPGKVLPEKPVEKPKNFDEMIDVVKKLSDGFPEVRVDLYLLPNDDIKFGELTFFSASGFSRWSPADVDRKLGDLIDLSSVKKDM